MNIKESEQSETKQRNMLQSGRVDMQELEYKKEIDKNINYYYNNPVKFSEMLKSVRKKEVTEQTVSTN